jgi:hypothetical protein
LQATVQVAGRDLVEADLLQRYQHLDDALGRTVEGKVVDDLVGILGSLDRRIEMARIVVVVAAELCEPRERL